MIGTRGQTETIGFVLVFSLIAVAVGLIYATGAAGLDDAQQAERLENVERAFDVLAENADEVRRGDAPSRATEVKLAGGDIGLGEATTIRIDAVDTGDTSRNVSFVSRPKVVSYRDGETEIVYSTDAVLRGDAGGAVMLKEPSWLVSNDQAVLNVVTTTGDSRRLGGNGVALVTLKRQSSGVAESLHASGSADVQVNVTVDSARAAAWKRYFEDQGHSPVDAAGADASDGTVAYQFTTERLYIVQTVLVVDAER